MVGDQDVPESPKVELVVCPKCGGEMDRGKVCLVSNASLRYHPGKDPVGLDELFIDWSNACMQCGYVELYTDPERLRAVVSGQRAPKRKKKRGWW